MTQTTYTPRPGYDRLWGMFGLSYASFLTLPRVLMHEMPDEWQDKMAALVEEYFEFYDVSELPNTTVRGVRDGKLVGLPDFIKNYRHPDLQRIKICKRKP